MRLRASCPTLGRAAIVMLVLAWPSATPAQSSPRARRSVTGPSQQWTLPTQPLLRLGGKTDGPEVFTNITSVLRTSRGDVAVGLMGDGEIRVFDAKGRHLNTLGKRGRGPGEFPVLWRVFRVGDELYGLDNAGITQVFGRDGKYTRTIPRLSAFGRRLEIAGFLRDGTVVGHYYPDPLERAPTGESSVPAMLVRLSPSRTDADSLFRVVAGTVHRRGADEPTAVAYAPRLQVATLADRFCLSASGEYRVSCYDATGKPVLQLSRPTDPRTSAITQADREAFFAGMDRANPDPRAAAFRRQIRERTEFAKVRPQIGRLLASTDHELWVGSYDPSEAIPGTVNPSPQQPMIWRVYSPNGEWLAELRTPARFRLMDVGRDWILGVSRDADDVEVVEMFAVVR